MSKYGAIVDALSTAFGVQFDYWHTGGGCTALVGAFESDITVYLTDAPESARGEECVITDYPTRLANGEHNYGYAVGVYRDDGCTNVAYREYPTLTVDGLPAAIREQIDAAR